MRVLAQALFYQSNIIFSFVVVGIARGWVMVVGLRSYFHNRKFHYNLFLLRYIQIHKYYGMLFFVGFRTTTVEVVNMSQNTIVLLVCRGIQVVHLASLCVLALGLRWWVWVGNIQATMSRKNRILPIHFFGILGSGRYIRSFRMEQALALGYLLVLDLPLHERMTHGEG